MAVKGAASFTLLLLCMLLVPIAGATPAGAGPPAPSQAQVTALTAKINVEAAHIHQLTEQLDEAHLKVNLASAHLVAVTRQHDATVQGMAANRAQLVNQALRAYMQGGDTEVTASASADIAISGEYLQVASGDLQQTGDQLAALDVSLRVQEATLQGAQQANLQATAQLLALRTSALSVAGAEQAQLDSFQSQLAAQAQAAAASSRLVPSTQGLPVNNGLIAVVQQAAGTLASTAAGQAPTLVTSEGTVGAEAGGVWLALRRCESSDNYAEDTGNGFYGAYQFSQSTWTGLGYPGRPDEEPASMQDQAAVKLQAESGWGQWPACSVALGLL